MAAKFDQSGLTVQLQSGEIVSITSILGGQGAQVIGGQLVQWGDEIWRIEFPTPGIQTAPVALRSEFITFARSSTAKIVIDGVEYTAQPNEYRVSRRGIVLEPGCTNIIPTPTNLLSASWLTSALNRAGNILDPKLELTAFRLTEDNANTYHGLYAPAIGGLATAPLTLSCLAAAGTGTKRYLCVYLPDNATILALFDLEFGTVTFQQNCRAEIMYVGNGYYLVSVTRTAANGLTQGGCGFYLSNSATVFGPYAGNGASFVDVYFPQLESNEFATTRQNTGDVRAPDICTTVVPAFGDPHKIEVKATPAGAQRWDRGTSMPLLCLGVIAAADTAELRLVSGGTRYTLVDAGPVARSNQTLVSTGYAGFRTICAASQGPAGNKPYTWADGLPSNQNSVGAGSGVAIFKWANSRVLRLGHDSNGVYGGFEVRKISISVDERPTFEERLPNVQRYAIGADYTLPNNRIAVVGHSWVEGTGVGTILELYPHRIARLKGRQYCADNYGIGSATTAQTLVRCRQEVWGQRYSQVIVDSVINDVSANYPVGLILSNLETITREAIEHGANRVIIVNGAPGNANNALTLTVNAGIALNASTWGAVVLDNYAAFDDPGNPGHMPAALGDGLHPTQAGYDLTADGAVPLVL